MNLLHCRSCNAIFPEEEIRIPEHCNACGGTQDLLETLNNDRARQLSDNDIEKLWKIYRDYCYYNEDGNSIDEQFMDFPSGTPLNDIWTWFDEIYSKGVNALINM